MDIGRENVENSLGNWLFQNFNKCLCICYYKYNDNNKALLWMKCISSFVKSICYDENL